MNYEIDCKIDEKALDVEWLEQAELAMEYSKHYAECMQILMVAEEKVKVVRAELIKKVSEDPEKFLGEGVKLTGATTEGFYRTHDRHKKAKQDLIDAQYELNMVEAAKKEIAVTRKKALENLVILHGQQYFAGPSVPRNLTKEVLENEKQKDADSKIKMKRK